MNDSQALLTVLIVVLFPVVFISLWCFVTLLLSWIGGWSTLAKCYPAAHKPGGGNWFSMETGTLGVSNYKSTLTVGITPEGFYLAVLPFFRVGHPPLLIPWAAFRRIEEKRFLFAYYAVTFALPGDRDREMTVTLLNRRIAEAIQAACPTITPAFV